MGKRIGYGKDLMAPHLADHDDDRRLAALGGLVRLQRRIQPSKPTARRSPSSTPIVATAAAACPGCSPNGRQGHAFAARYDLGRGRRTCGRHAGFRFRPADGIGRAWSRRRRDLLFLSLCEERFGTTTRSTSSASTASAESSARSAPASWWLRARRRRHHGLHQIAARSPALRDAAQMISRRSRLPTLIWSGVGSAILYKVVDVIVGCGPSETERKARRNRARGAGLQYVSSPGARSPKSTPVATVWAHTRQCPDREGLQRKLGPLSFRT